MIKVLLVFRTVIVFLRFMIVLSRILRCLIILENLNALILMIRLLVNVSTVRTSFLVLMILFTVEVTVCLVILTRQ